MNMKCAKSLKKKRIGTVLLFGLLLLSVTTGAQTVETDANEFIVKNSLSLNYANEINSVTGDISNTGFDNVEHNKLYKYGWSISLLYQRKLSNYFTIETGFLTMIKGYRDRRVWHDDIIIPPRPDVITLSRYSDHFLSIPLNFKLYLGNSKTKWFASLGASADYNTFSNDWSMGTMVEFGAELQIGKTTLIIAPQARYLSLVASQAMDNHYYAIGLNTGIRFGL